MGKELFFKLVIFALDGRATDGSIALPRLFHDRAAAFLS
jgi:hypothetical protein